MALHHFTVPNYIESSSPQGLRRLMFLTNIKYRGQVNFFDVKSYSDKRGRTRWIAWFYETIDEQKATQLLEASSELSNDSN